MNDAPALCTEADITTMVERFYARVRADERLGPVFDAHVDDWPTHLARLGDFWSAVLLKTRRFSGTPMPTHAALPELSAELFERWLALFRDNAARQPNQAMAQQAVAAAERIAQSLWMGWQMARDPSAPVQPLPGRSG